MDIVSSFTDLLSSALGAIMSLYLLTIPVLLETSRTSADLLKQWNLIFGKGHKQGPLISLATGCMHFFVAWRSGTLLYAVAGATTIAMVPYTWIFMRNINSSLFAANGWTDAIKETSGGRIRGLVASWSRYNAVRALFPLSGAIVGVLTLIGEAAAFRG